jgi:hypothetical protein
MVLVGVAACGGSATEEIAPSTTIPSSTPGSIDLAGLSFEVHQEPG